MLTNIYFLSKHIIEAKGIGGLVNPT
jgi:hypothetical protein